MSEHEIVMPAKLPHVLSPEEQRLINLKLQKLKTLEAKDREREMLPHLYAHKRYKWTREFEEDISSRIQVLVAANQIGKSTTAITKAIRWATEPDLWPKIWPNMDMKFFKPTTFWYLYPTNQMAVQEFHEKWMPLLPKDKDHPVYGWKKVAPSQTLISCIKFNSGVTIYFKSYAQDVQALQGGSVYALFCDEEVPTSVLPELQMRVNATDGVLFFVFTATLGQEHWRRVVEERSVWKKEARVWQISLWDCLKYEDGTPSPWTRERVNRTIERCVSESEVKRRVYGRFVMDRNRTYPYLSYEKHLIKAHKIPDNWIYVAGVDHGAGGTAHPSAVTILAHNPECTECRVVRHWRGDGIETTVQDCVQKCLDMCDGLPIQNVFYDWAAKDMGIIAMRQGHSWVFAKKDVMAGQNAINTLTKFMALKIFDDSDESQKITGVIADHLQGIKIIQESETLRIDGPKFHKKDDSLDSLRYATSSVFWQFARIAGTEEKRIDNLKKDIEDQMMARRRGEADQQFQDMGPSHEEEIEFWNEMLEG